MQESKASRGLEQLAALMAAGKVKAHIDRSFRAAECLCSSNPIPPCTMATLPPMHPPLLPLRRVHPLEELAAAHEYAEQGHVRGKVVIAICEDPAARWLGAAAAQPQSQPAAA